MVGAGPRPTPNGSLIAPARPEWCFYALLESPGDGHEVKARPTTWSAAVLPSRRHSAGSA